MNTLCEYLGKMMLLRQRINTYAVIMFQRCSRSKAKMEDVLLNHQPLVLFVCHPISLSFLRDFNAALQDMVKNHIVRATTNLSQLVTCLFAKSLTFMANIMSPDTGYSKYLKEGHVSLLSDVQCRRKDYYGARINGNMFCAARPDWTIDACKVSWLMQSELTLCNHASIQTIRHLGTDWQLFVFFTGRLRGSTGLWSFGPNVSVWGGQLGGRLCQKEQTRSLHKGYQLQQMDWREYRSPQIHRRNNVPHKMKPWWKLNEHFFDKGSLLALLYE